MVFVLDLPITTPCLLERVVIISTFTRNLTFYSEKTWRYFFEETKFDFLYSSWKNYSSFHSTTFYSTVGDRAGQGWGPQILIYHIRWIIKECLYQIKSN